MYTRRLWPVEDLPPLQTVALLTQLCKSNLSPCSGRRVELRGVASVPAPIPSLSPVSADWLAPRHFLKYSQRLALAELCADTNSMEGSLASLRYRLGVGTIWMGRPWPPSNDTYVRPKLDETTGFLETAFSSLGAEGCPVMLDTATAYETTKAVLDAMWHFWRTFVCSMPPASIGTVELAPPLSSGICLALY